MTADGGGGASPPPARGDAMFFHSWDSLLRTVVVGALAYAGLIAMLRVSGKQTLAKMNAFDLAVTVAIGSTLATVLLTKDVSLADGLTGFALLIALPYAVTWTSVRWRVVRRLVRAEPALLFYRGEFNDGMMRRERVTDGEVRQAVRSSGVRDLDKVEAVVLETDGTFAVIPRSEAGGGPASALEGVYCSPRAACPDPARDGE